MIASVENHLGDDCRQTGKLAWRQGWKIRLATTAPELENYHGGRQSASAGIIEEDHAGLKVLLSDKDAGIGKIGCNVDFPTCRN